MDSTSNIINQLSSQKKNTSNENTIERDEWIRKFKNRRKFDFEPNKGYVKSPYVKKKLTYEVLADITYREMIKRAKRQKRDVVVLDENVNTMASIINTFISKEKGIFLFGINSSGKTFALKSLVKGWNNLAYSGMYGIEPIRMIDYKLIAKNIEKEGNRDVVYNIRNSYLIDDMGYLGESKQNNFGTQIDIFNEIVFQCNRVHVEKGENFYFTSNLTPELIAKKYGKATIDRLTEMCNFHYWEIKENGFRS